MPRKKDDGARVALAFSAATVAMLLAIAASVLLVHRDVPEQTRLERAIATGCRARAQ